MRTCIAERGATTIPHTHPLVVAGCVLPYDNDLLDWNSRTAAENWADRQALLAAFPDRPIVDKYHGCLKATADCLNRDTYIKATVDQVWTGMLVNRLDVSREVALLTPFAKLYSGGPKADWILIDFEPQSLFWNWEKPTDPAKVAEWQDALNRRNDLLVRIFSTPATRRYIGSDINDVPQDAAGILALFDIYTLSQQPNFDRHQCAVMKWLNTLYMKAVKDLFSACGMWGPKVIMAFCGRWNKDFKDGKWTLPQTQLTAPMQSAWQLYSPGFSDFPNKVKGAKSVRWVGWWSGDTEPDELRALLEVCTGDTAILYVERPDVAERLAGVVGKWIGT